MRQFLLACFLACLFAFITPSFADEGPVPLYKQPSHSLRTADDDEAAVSPKQGWKTLPQRRTSSSDNTPWWAHVLLWVPNRFMDLIDVFRIDAGAGPAFGGVIRVTQGAQAGYRRMLPFSLRVGDFGRKAPFLVETDDETGAGRRFKKSEDRESCVGEIGLGLDLGLGLYGAVCSEELLDFVAGIFFIDLEADDLG